MAQEGSVSLAQERPDLAEYALKVFLRPQYAPSATIYLNVSNRFQMTPHVIYEFAPTWEIKPKKHTILFFLLLVKLKGFI